MKIAGMSLNIVHPAFLIFCSYCFSHFAQILMCQGATIVDQSICISRWGSYIDDASPWDWKTREDTSSMVCVNLFNEDSNLTIWFFMIFDAFPMECFCM